MALKVDKAASDHPKIPLVDGHVHAPAGMASPKDLDRLLENYKKVDEDRELQAGEYRVGAEDGTKKYEIKLREGISPAFVPKPADGRTFFTDTLNIQVKDGRFVYNDLDSFVEAYGYVNKLFDTPEKLEKIIKKYIEESSRQGCVLAEIQINPAVASQFVGYSDPRTEFRRALERCREFGEFERGMKINYLSAFVRSNDLQSNFNNGSRDIIDFQQVAGEFKRPLFNGIQAGGPEDRGDDEQLLPGLIAAASDVTEPYMKMLEGAFQAGTHAGEVRGPESIGEALGMLRFLRDAGYKGGMRIGHGLSAHLLKGKDQKYIVDTHSRLEACPGINELIGWFHPEEGKSKPDGLENHPLPELYKKFKNNVLLGTDNPGWGVGCVGDQVEKIMQVFGPEGSKELSWADILKMQVNAVVTSALTRAEKIEVLDNMYARIGMQGKKYEEYLNIVELGEQRLGVQMLGYEQSVLQSHTRRLIN